MADLLGYLSSWSARPGAEVAVKVSASAGPAAVQVIDLVDAARPALSEQSEVTVAPQALDAGSSFHADRVPIPRVGTVAVWLRPTSTAGDVLSLGDGAWELRVIRSADAAVRVVLRMNGDEISTHRGGALPAGEWTLLLVEWQHEDARARVGISLVTEGRARLAEHSASVRPIAPASGSLHIGGGPDPYTGRIAFPAVIDGRLDIDEMIALGACSTADQILGLLDDRAQRLWDFADDPGAPEPADRITGAIASLRQRPLARLLGPGAGEGRTDSAVHLAAEDLADAGWQTTTTVRVPGGVSGTVAGVRVQRGASTITLPLIASGRDHPGSPDSVAVVLPTLTYLAYANHRQSSEAAHFGDYTAVALHPPVLSDIDTYLNSHPELGPSIYDRRADGTAAYHSSRARPVLNFDPDYRWWMTGESRHLSTDLRLVTWLRDQQVTSVVLTDEDVHEGGVELLARHRVVVLASHPEYVTAAMRAAIDQYLSAGGRVMYLGGNGLYWVTEIDDRYPDALEVRRRGAEGWWDNEPGEARLTRSGQPGGTWRSAGEPPNEVLGVGFCAQGWGPAQPYERTDASDDPAVGWVFTDVVPRIFGDTGLSLGGAAGDELDRYDVALGSHPDAFLLATSAGRHSDHYQPAVEDRLTGLDTVRADLTLTAERNGAAVFSVGSINWITSMFERDRRGGLRETDVATVTRNVLRRFLATPPHTSVAG